MTTYSMIWCLIHNTSIEFARWRHLCTCV